MKSGTVLENRYVLKSQIGKGGMSQVYLAKDLHLQKNWAIKVVEKKNNFAYRSTQQEASLLARLNHPSLVRVIDVFEDLFNYYIVMDYIEGKSLEEILKEKGPYKLEEGLAIAIEICKVIDYLHSLHPPIIYRDMKPANIMVQSQGHIILIDLGIVREYTYTKIKDTLNLGTRQYAAPEQFEGKSDERTDVYGIGKTIDELIEPSQRDERLSQILHKCVMNQPNARYQSVDSLICDLVEYRYRMTHNQNALYKRMVYFLIGSLFFLFTIVIYFSLENAYSITRQLEYNQKLLAFNTSNNLADLVEAITFEPSYKQGYIALIEAIKEDEIYSLEEENYLLPCIQYLLNQAFRQEINYEAGKLYWYYYEVESIEIRYKNASKLMKNGDPSKTEIYLKIADFYLSYSSKLMEGNESGIYQECFINLCELVDSLKKEGNEYMRLQSIDQLVSMILSYYPRLIDDGLTIDQIRNQIQTIEIELEYFQEGNERIKKMKDELYRKIEVSYEIMD